MTTFLTVLYIIVCIFLILVVLLQAGKGGGMGSAFGGSGVQTFFGGAGAGNFLTRLTVICAMLFMMLSATLAYLSSSSEKSLERATEAIKLREHARKAAILKRNAREKKNAAESGGVSLPEGEKSAGQPATGAAEGSPSGSAPAGQQVKVIRIPVGGQVPLTVESTTGSPTGAKAPQVHFVESSAPAEKPAQPPSSAAPQAKSPAPDKPPAEKKPERGPWP